MASERHGMRAMRMLGAAGALLLALTVPTAAPAAELQPTGADGQYQVAAPPAGGGAVSFDVSTTPPDGSSCKGPFKRIQFHLRKTLPLDGTPEQVTKLESSTTSYAVSIPYVGDSTRFASVHLTPWGDWTGEIWSWSVEGIITDLIIPLGCNTAMGTVCICSLVKDDPPPTTPTTPTPVEPQPQEPVAPATPPEPELPAPSFDWEAPALLHDENADGAPDAYPPLDSTYPIDVTLNGGRCDRSLRYDWTVDGRSVMATGTGCTRHLRFDHEGRFDVAVVASSGTRRSQATHARVLVQTWLVLSLGDSVASGEGNPPWIGADGRRCHRSAMAGPARAAMLLEAHDRKTNVAFVHLACSGATVARGVVGAYGGIVAPAKGAPLPAQTAVARKKAAGREVDALMLSIGANDVGFGSIVEFCVTHAKCPTAAFTKQRTLHQEVLAQLAAQAARYASVGKSLGGLVEPSRVFATEYFNPLRTETGAACALVGMDAAEARWAEGSVLAGLNHGVARAARTQHWKAVPVAAGFAAHGYCARQSWIVRIKDALLREDAAVQLLHPNAAGHGFYGQQLANAIVPTLYPGGQPRAPRG